MSGRSLRGTGRGCQFPWNAGLSGQRESLLRGTWWHSGIAVGILKKYGLSVRTGAGASSTTEKIVKKYQDHFFHKAKRENYAARSVYKLKEIDQRFSLFRPGLRVLDLGAAPGSWTQYLAERVGPSGRVIAVDLTPITISLPDWVHAFAGDVFDLPEDAEAALKDIGPLDAVVSDMAPKTSGVTFRDQARSMDLALRALDLARARLVESGAFVVKVFQGPDVPQFQQALKSVFRTAKSFKPKSSRAESKEMFFIGIHLH